MGLQVSTHIFSKKIGRPVRLVPERDLAPAFLNLSKKVERSGLLPVYLQNGRFFMHLTAEMLNELYGHGWMFGVVCDKHQALHGIVSTISIRRFQWEIEQIIGAALPTKFQQGEMDELWQNPICSTCGDQKPRCDFSLDKYLTDLYGMRDGNAHLNHGICDSCTKSAMRRSASTNGQIRRAREASAVGKHADAEWLAVLKRFRRRCLRCGTRRDVTKDHIQPLAKGGSNSVDNLQPLCRRCNSWKGIKTVDFRDNPSKETRKLFPKAHIPSGGSP